MRLKMFFEGSLQEGISTAVGQQKLVLCFVTDESEEAQLWENEFLTDSSLSDLIKNQAVALRLTAGSEEAGYLAQIFPLPQTPTIVLMKHGELKEYITPKTTKEDFLRRVKNAFSATAQPAPASSQAATTTATSSTPDAEAGPAPTSNASQQSDHVRRILAERAAKLHAQKEEADRKAKDARLKAKEKAKAEADAGEDTEAAKKHKHTEIVKQQKQQAREARERVLKRIEDDKEERRSRAVEQEKIRLEGQKVGDVAASLVKSPETKMPSTTKVGEMTYIQVRLFDGSSIRTRFKTASPLKDARTWVDESRTDGNTPYTFKQVISPTQNKAIDVTEEKESLGDLGFAPSATLVLIPVPTYASAYGMASGNVLTQFFTFVVGIFTWIFSLVGLGGRRGPAREDDATDRPERSQAQGSQGPEDRRRDQQLYNGNSLNFEPRPDDDEK